MEYGVLFMEEINAKQLEFDFMNNDRYIFKSNNLIESNYNLSVNEQRLIYLGTKKLKPMFVKSNVKPSDLVTYASTQKFGNIKIYVNEFKNEFELKGNSFYERLMETCENLFGREFMYFNDKGNFVKKRWVITSEYDKDSKYVSLTFHPDLILDLLIFKNKYGKLQFNVAKYLNTNYSFRIYEILKNSAHKNSRIMTISEIREKLEIEPEKYQIYSKFKRDVIDRSLELINKHSDITVTYNPIRKGRSIDSLEFNIELKDDEICVDVYDKPETEHVNNMIAIVGHALTDNQVNELTNSSLEAIKQYNLDIGIYDYIQEKVGVVNDYAKTNTINNYFGTLNAAVKNNWQSNIIIKDNKINFTNYENQRQYSDDDIRLLEQNY